MENTDTGVDPSSLGFIGGFGIADPQRENRLFNTSFNTETPKTDESKDQPGNTQKNEQQVADGGQKKVVDTTKNVDNNKSSLSDLIRESRLERERHAAQLSEANKYKTELDSVKAELTTFKSAKAFEDDPVGYVKARKLTPQQQISLGEALIYDLAPSKAPPDLRQRMFEMAQERKETERTKAEQEARKANDIQMVQRNIESFAQSLEQAARSFTEGSYPESESWFVTGDGTTDYDNYCKSLMATANNIATMATKNKTSADLSHKNIASTLEAELDRRMKLRETKRKGPSQSVTQPDKVINRPEVEEVISSGKGLNSGGKPDRYDLDDDERIRRAIRAGFGN